MTELHILKGRKSERPGDSSEKFQADYEAWLQRRRDELNFRGVDIKSLSDLRQAKETFFAFQENPDMSDEDAKKIGPKAVIILELLRENGDNGPSPAAPGARMPKPRKSEEPSQERRMAA